MAGLGERERVRLYAGLVAEEALTYRKLGNKTSEHLSGRRAPELNAALTDSLKQFDITPSRRHLQSLRPC